MFSKSRSSKSEPVHVALAVLAILVILGALAFIVLKMATPRKAGRPSSPAAVTPPPVGNARPSPVISGTVKAIEGNTLTISVVGVPADYGMKYEASERVAHLTNGTNVTLATNVSSEKFQKLQDEYVKALKNADPAHYPKAPMPSVVTSGEVSDISVGDGVSVTSIDNADISTSSSFSVSQISIQHAVTN